MEALGDSIKKIVSHVFQSDSLFSETRSRFDSTRRSTLDHADDRSAAAYSILSKTQDHNCS